MRVLITGAGGNLGTALAPLLADAGYQPVLFDLQPVGGSCESIQGDIRRLEDVRAAVRGVEYVVHLAAILGIASATAQDFYEINLTGTFNLWEAAAEAGVRGLVFSSTMSVYKPHDQSLRADAVTAVGEETPMQPRDLYGYTKAAGEEMCRLYGRSHGIPSIALRYGMFSPEPFFTYGIRLLYGGVDRDDVARAVVAAVDALAAGRVGWDVFNIESRVRFTEDNHPGLLRDPLAVLDRHYPGSAALLRERVVERLAPVHDYYPVTRAADLLGFHPQRNFEQWLEELRTRPGARAEKNPPWP